MSWKKVAGIITAVLTFPYIKNVKVGLETKRERYSPYVAYEVPLKGDDSVSILRNLPGSYMKNSFYRIVHLFFGDYHVLTVLPPYFQFIYLVYFILLHYFHSLPCLIQSVIQVIQYFVR